MDQAKRLKELEKENGKLKRLVAELSLDKQILKDDRILWVWLSRMWADWKLALRIVKPETVIGWHRKGYRLYWRWKSRTRHGRPPESFLKRQKA